ncbi:sigma factor [Algoriphagus sp. C2-6-M1]|uniref:RNA polymerase sigma factor n=1 Tax=Algoriphagus persicinus TaxID=3108754 RepID=UPI002B3A8C65|nr:sigma factor [Algoriphagus sp. C2-6-M1]MEB2782879.1 sigma factor [Algoriphagus sp. C2-6-M1]
MQKERIIAGLKAKDRMTTEYFYEKYSRPLFAVICRIISDREVAEEVFYTSFIKIMTDIESYEYSKNGPFYAWMAGICRRASSGVIAK